MVKKIEKIDYAAEIAKTKEALFTDKLNAIVLAPSGGGKSCLAGTFGVKTLYLYGSSEKHGPKNANAFSNCEVVPICVDLGRSNDEALDFTLNILRDKDFLADFGAVVIDSSNSFELIIKGSERFIQACQNDKGKHNSFVESDRMLAIFSEILDALRETGKHTLMTCILDVKELDSETGEIMDASPRISTYSLAEGLIMQHGDVFTVGCITVGEKSGHRLQFSSRISKVSKDQMGRVKRLQNFTPRLAGYKGKLPAHLPADLSKLIEFKNGTAK